MNKYNFFPLLVILLVFGISDSKLDYNLAEDVQDQLENLRAIVLGNIQTAQDSFAHFYSDITSYSHNAINLGDLSIDQVYEEVSTQLNQIKELAQQTNKSIGYCTGGREQMINKLPNELKQRLENCIVEQNEEAAKVLDSSIYIIDITMSRVQHYEFQIKQCGDSSLCLSPIIIKIENDMISLPTEIKVQVNEAQDLLNELKVIVENCKDNNVADFTGYVTDLITQIADCANKIIG